MRWTNLLCGTAAITLAGCANLLSISRESDIVGTYSRDDEKGKAIHLDAKQRLVFSDARALCAEPSPDALSALAASASGGLTGGTDAVSVAQALNETAASIGVRTQSITLMRDTLYRMCEAYHNSAIEREDYVQLLQRSQDLTLGVLAIEQLTGVAMASQAALSGDANASAASALQTTEEMLKKRREQESEARQKKADADKKVDNTKEQMKTHGDNAPDGADDDAKAEHAKKKNDLEKQLEVDQADAKTKGDALKDAENATKVVERNRDAAYAEANAAASGSAELRTPGKAGVELKEASAANIAGAVERIVSTVIGKNHLVDNCVNFLITDAKGGDDKRSEAEILSDIKAKTAMSTICGKVMDADIEMRKKSNMAQANAYEGYYKGPFPKPKPGDTPKPSTDKLTPPPSGVY